MNDYLINWAAGPATVVEYEWIGSQWRMTGSKVDESPDDQWARWARRHLSREDLEFKRGLARLTSRPIGNVSLVVKRSREPG